MADKDFELIWNKREKPPNWIYYKISRPGVYIAGTNKPKYVKIGSSDNCLRRVSDLQIGNPHNLYIHAIIDHNPRTETYYHKKYAHLKYNGEWFLYTKELKEDVENIKKWFKYYGSMKDYTKLCEYRLKTNSLIH